jgi:hypothetical protein
MIAPLSSFTPALSSMAGVSLRMSASGEYKQWDVKQEGGQMDPGWGTGEFSILDLRNLIDFGILGHHYHHHPIL